MALKILCWAEKMQIQSMKLVAPDIINHMNQKHFKLVIRRLINKNGRMNIKKEKKIFCTEQYRKDILIILDMSQGIYGNI